MLTIHPLILPMSNVFLLENPHGLYLVDAGPPGSEHKILKLMQTLRRSDLRLVFITHAHFDHYGGAAALQRATGARLAIHAADGKTMALGHSAIRLTRGRGKLVRILLPLLQRLYPPEPARADLLLNDGDRLDTCGLDAWVLHTPGHTPGSSCLIVEQETAFAGDLLSASGRPHVQALFADDWQQIGTSLARLQSLNPLCVYAGHGRKPISRVGLQHLHVG